MLLKSGLIFIRLFLCCWCCCWSCYLNTVFLSNPARYYSLLLSQPPLFLLTSSSLLRTSSFSVLSSSLVLLSSSWVLFSSCCTTWLWSASLPAFCAFSAVSATSWEKEPNAPSVQLFPHQTDWILHLYSWTNVKKIKPPCRAGLWAPHIGSCSVVRSSWPGWWSCSSPGCHCFWFPPPFSGCLSLTSDGPQSLSELVAGTELSYCSHWIWCKHNKVHWSIHCSAIKRKNFIFW